QRAVGARNQMEGPGRSQHRSSVFLVAIAAPNGPNVRARLGPNVRAGILSFFRQRPPTIRRLRCLTFLAYSMRLTRQSLVVANPGPPAETSPRRVGALSKRGGRVL